ncbi:hypothetical protein WA171_000442 [Blastocystis sp. BT1]
MAETVVTRFTALAKRVTELSQQLNRTVPRIVAVSKKKPAENIQELYDYGHRDFGENYVQELMDKAEILPKDIKWHLIGHLQSGKCNQLLRKIPNLWVIESVDSIKLAEKLNSACSLAERKDPLNVFVEVHTSGEESKSGCLPEEFTSLAEFILSECPKLRLMGLMTIGKLDAPPEPYFTKLIQLRDSFVEKHPEVGTLELSMGMSGDWETAVKMGSTNIRVGTTIFGARVYN